MEQNNPQTGQYNQQTTDYNPYAQWDETPSQNAYWMAGILGAVALGVAAAYLWLRNDDESRDTLAKKGEKLRKGALETAHDLLEQAPDLADLRETMADTGKHFSETMADTGKHLSETVADTGKHLRERKSKEGKGLLGLAGLIGAKSALDRLSEMRDTTMESAEEKADKLADDYLALMKETEHRRNNLVKELATALKRSREQFEDLQNQALELVDDRRLHQEIKARQKHMREVESRLNKALM